MSHDPEVLDRILDAYDENNVAEFKRLMKAHPEFLFYEDEDWLYKATMHRNLPILAALVELGRDVNEPHFPGTDEKDSFYEPEGPILDAVRLGFDDVVEWLLEHGAKINYVVNGSPRCMPLMAAASGGHLNIAKMLVAHGADVHSTWHGSNAISQAEEMGKLEVRDYLLSLSRPAPPS